MQLTDADAELLKAWVVTRLEHATDADSDVLADYVLALIKTDEADRAVLKASSVANLHDFLGEASGSFVDDLFAALESRSYDASKNGLVGDEQAHVTARGKDFLGDARRSNESRKRRYDDGGWDAPGGRGAAFQRPYADRPMKQPRRGGKARFDPAGRLPQAHPSPQQTMRAFPPPPSLQDMLAFPPPPPAAAMDPNNLMDPNNPMAMLMAMQAMGIPLPGMPPPPQLAHAAPRCRDYDTKGFCALGVSCLYDHGNDRVVVPPPPEAYDPANAALTSLAPSGTAGFGFDNVASAFNDRGRGGFRGRGRGNFRGNSKRADFSHAGPMHDHTNCKIVVEQIPEQSFSEEAVRAYFTQYGAVDGVEMQPYKRLAIVAFTSHDDAQQAYESPQVIFDNRFVKVYWHRADTLPTPPRNANSTASQRNGHAAPSNTGLDAEMADSAPIDLEAVAKKQAEAQRRHDSSKQKAAEADKARSELNAKLAAMEAERRTMQAALAKKASKPSPSEPKSIPGAADGDTHAPKPESASTTALKAQLAKLESEARSIGIDPDAVTSPSQRWPGFPPRGGRGYHAPNASYRGGAVMRLDNRPKTVVVIFPNGSGLAGANGEALRQFLLFSDALEAAKLAPHPGRGDAALVGFGERFVAEKFMAACGGEVPHLGKVGLEWWSGVVPPAGGREEGGKAGLGGEALLGAGAGAGAGASAGAGGEGDDAYDVADEDGRWG